MLTARLVVLARVRRWLVLLGALIALRFGALTSSELRVGWLIGTAHASDVAPLVDGEELARTWPSRLGTKVRLRSHVERATDLLHVLVRSGNEPFSVMLSPGAAWNGDAVRTFTVMGSTTVRLPGGPLKVAELLLDEPVK